MRNRTWQISILIGKIKLHVQKLFFISQVYPYCTSSACRKHILSKYLHNVYLDHSSRQTAIISSDLVESWFISIKLTLSFTLIG